MALANILLYGKRMGSHFSQAGADLSGFACHFNTVPVYGQFHWISSRLDSSYSFFTPEWS
jgi:hypothetical protein